jgi:hypothetical protein
MELETHRFLGSTPMRLSQDVLGEIQDVVFVKSSHAILRKD